MGLFDSIKSVFGGSGGASSARREHDRVCIVDAEKLADSREGRTGPVERFRAIQQLSRFAEREKLEMIAVVGGRPLREVANGETFNGVRVFYVEENSTIADQMEKTLGQVRGRKPVVVTNDKQLETRLQQRGIAVMRVSTLKKAFDSGDSVVAEENGRGRGDRERRRRRGGGRPERPLSQDQSGDESDGSAASAGEEDQLNAGNQKPQDTVDGLIDRVK